MTELIKCDGCGMLREWNRFNCLTVCPCMEETKELTNEGEEMTQEQKDKIDFYNQAGEFIGGTFTVYDRDAIWQWIEAKKEEWIREAKIENYLIKQKEWSLKTFGDTKRTKGIVEHIRKELQEILDNPDDLSEWIDVMILSLDGYWRHGGENVMDDLIMKQNKNFNREYPFPESEDKPSEHNRNLDQLKEKK